MSYEALTEQEAEESSVALGHFLCERLVCIKYTNWRKETSYRSVLPLNFKFGSTPWHPEPQWLMEAFDLKKQEVRFFALRDIQWWYDGKPVKSEEEENTDHGEESRSST